MTEELLEFIKDCIKKDDMHPFYVRKEWKKKRIEIIKRDHFECCECKRKGIIKVLRLKSVDREERAYVHHMKHLEDYPELALVDSNLETLCFNCHEQKHISERHQFKCEGSFINEERW